MGLHFYAMTEISMVRPMSCLLQSWLARDRVFKVRKGEYYIRKFSRRKLSTGRDCWESVYSNIPDFFEGSEISERLTTFHQKALQCMRESNAGKADVLLMFIECLFRIGKQRPSHTNNRFWQSTLFPDCASQCSIMYLMCAIFTKGGSRQ